jgi:hypothetical protein
VGVLCVLINSGSGGFNIDQAVFLPDSKPYGISFQKWTERWWQWLLAIPKSINPAIDTFGKNCAQNQTDPNVWFLAGTTGGYAERKCTVPAGKAILCPILNFEISAAEEPDLKTDSDLALRARTDIDNIARLDVIIDGLHLPNLKKYRIESGSFDVTLPQDNIWGVKPGLTRAAADGFWLFLKPLQRGKHQIQFGGSCLAGTVNIGAAYSLTVQ